MPTLVLKYGGNAITDTHALDDFARTIASLSQTHRLVIVHGGGPQINHWLEKTGIESHFINGQRYTDTAALEVVEMALCAHVNKSIVRALSAQQLSAVGISGQDGNLLIAEPQPTLGAVGKITATHPELLHALMDNGYIPVIAPLACSANHQALNINADYAAAHIAGALQADDCLFMTNVDGLLSADKQRIEHATQTDIHALIADGTINGGMIPKVQCALAALEQGVKQTRIINGLTMDALQQFSQGQETIGTRITQS